MHMAVDATRQHQLARRVDHLVRPPRSSPSATILPPRMPTSQTTVVAGVGNAPAADDGIDFAHQLPLYVE
jgi:hypothetical protein